LRHIIPEVSKTTIHEAVTEKLGYRKLCGRWVPKILTDDHKTKRMGSALKFLTRYAQGGDVFLDSIVTGDETLAFHHTPESKQQLLQWRHTHSPKTFAFGGTLVRRCHFKNVSLKQSRFYHSNEHGSQVKDQGRRQCCHNKHNIFPYRPTRDVPLFS
jgi:hypothetical protein